ncbi:hypothetical protein FC83_GL003302 [Agrilactobacillus composti DSM 18527 = JCM 14202]|uniref:Uncharacterized protein n=1 Tax=Agrilactobacillus composti DSM 18527 = JCM 14202 TaxID=1423734 RepID=A0A0R1Y1M2_9LACO|nr:hypothetical protein FC83_GL003302 [Agrilactobacillus composti DSM 18527 = JCM 14202]
MSIVVSIFVPSISLTALVALTALLIVLTVAIISLLRRHPTSQSGLVPKKLPFLGWTINRRNPNYLAVMFYLMDFVAFLAGTMILPGNF